jgi:hypothetical protein
LNAEQYTTFCRKNSSRIFLQTLRGGHSEYSLRRTEASCEKRIPNALLLWAAQPETMPQEKGIGIDTVEGEKEKPGRALMHVPVRAGRDLALN